MIAKIFPITPKNTKSTFLTSSKNLKYKPGNNCEHKVSRPQKFNIPENHNKRPFILKRAYEQLEKYYLYPHQFLSSLNLNSAGTYRQKRSERREAIKVVLEVIIYYLDLYSLRFGIFQQNSEFTNFSISFITHKSDLAESRVKRALTDLKNAGYLDITKQYSKDDRGSYIASGSIRKLNKKFFDELKIDYMQVLKSQEWKRKRINQAYAKKNRFSLKTALKVKSQKSKAINIIFKTASHNQFVVTNKKKLIDQALEIHRLNTHVSIIEIYKSLLSKRSHQL